MNHQSNSLQASDATDYVIAQDSGGNKPLDTPPGNDYTPFVLALAVFVVVLKGYQRGS
ncbi:MAG: hypothetical protein AAF050_15215 [Cyanobacteria bacterium J06649_5]